MLSNEFGKLLTPYRLLANRHALAPKYRVIEVAPDHVTACAPYAILDTMTAVDINDTAQVEASSFLAIVDSLPPGKELSMSMKDGAMSWVCGQARGKLACLPPVDMDALPGDPTSQCTNTNKALATAFELGALSCAPNDPNTYGVVIDNRMQVICSTDNTTLSIYRLPTSLNSASEVVTLPPPGAEVLSAIMRDGGQVEILPDRVIYRDQTTACVVGQVQPIKADVRHIMTQYEEASAFVVIPKDRITAFVKRATALTENKRNARVMIGAEEGRIVMSFDEGTSSSEEYFLADGLNDFPSMPPVSVNADKLARALSYANTLVLDYIDRGVIVLQEANGPFRYLISGTMTATV